MFPMITIRSSLIRTRIISLFLLLCVPSVFPQENVRLESWKQALTDPNKHIRANAAYGIRDAALERDDFIPVITSLCEVLRDPDKEVRRASRHSLDLIKYKIIRYPALIPSLIRLLEDGDDCQKNQSLGSLIKFGNDAIPSLLKLIPKENKKSLTTRKYATFALAEIRSDSEKPIQPLISLMNDESEEEFIRIWAAIALARKGRELSDATPLVLQALQFNIAYTRNAAAQTLGLIDNPDPQIIAALFTAAKKEKQTFDRVQSEYNSYPKDRIETWEEESQYRNLSIEYYESAMTRYAIANTLADLHAEPVKALLDILLEMAVEKDFYVEIDDVQRHIYFGDITGPYLFESYPAGATSERSIAPIFLKLPKSSVPFLLGLYKQNLNKQLRVMVILGFIGIGEEAKDAIPLLIATLNGAVNIKEDADKDVDSATPKYIVEALGKIGSANPELAIPVLIDILNGRIFAEEAAEQLLYISKKLAKREETEHLGLLNKALNSLKQSEDPDISKITEEVAFQIQYLNLVWWNKGIAGYIKEYRNYLLVASVFPCLLLLCFLLLWLRPLWLFKINESLSSLPIEGIRAPQWLGGFSLSPRYLLMVGFFHYQPRVLDAWVSSQLDIAREIFKCKQTVKDREFHFPVPVKLNNQNVADMTTSNLSQLFSGGISYLLITGEGGSGKTSLAVLLARRAMAEGNEKLWHHHMLPILIEHDLKLQSDGSGKALEKTIATQLRFLIKGGENPSLQLVRHLLKHKRLLLIVDSFSEMLAGTRQQILAEIKELPINAVIITSRWAEESTDIVFDVMQPFLISGKYLFDFFSSYFSYKKVREHFDVDDFHQSYDRLRQISCGRDITALLIKLYAEQMVAVKTQKTNEAAPQNFPDLILRYLNNLNRDYNEGKKRNENVHQYAKMIAWKYMEQEFRPTPANIIEVRKALGSSADADEIIDHLDKKLGLIQLTEPGDRIRFTLDPLAEYLACLYLIDACGQNKKEWQDLLNNLTKSLNEKHENRGFIMALQECCLTKAEGRIPEFVLSQIISLSGIDIEELRKRSLKKRLQQIMDDLRYFEPEELTSLSQELSSMNVEKAI